MNKTIIIIIIAIIALTAGVGSAYAVSRVITTNQAGAIGAVEAWQIGETGFPCDAPGEQEFSRCWPDSGRYSFGQLQEGWMQPDNRGGMGPGMMGRGGYYQDDTQQGERISIDEAFEAAKEYAGEMAENLRVVEVMEFSRNFYAVVLESDTGRGAMELLINPYTASVRLEVGPARMWNTKYGHMRLRVDEPTVNTVTMAQAAAAAQSLLETEVVGAELDVEGIDFYGYYSFDYAVDGEVTGMLSVNGTSGQVWPHTWHGTFMAEKEFDE